jgi:hypothetical protein
MLKSLRSYDLVAAGSDLRCVTWFAVPLLLGVILLAGFVLATAGNAHCVWVSVRRKEHHSTVSMSALRSSFSLSGRWPSQHSAPVRWSRVASAAWSFR